MDGVSTDVLPGHMKHWLPNGILILECVANLELVSRRCLFVAAPLPIEHGSGSPLPRFALLLSAPMTPEATSCVLERKERCRASGMAATRLTLTRAI